MISFEDNNCIITDDSGKWAASHPVSWTAGPASLSYKSDLLIEDCCGYSGTFSEKTAVTKKLKDFHKSGESWLETNGFVPCTEGKVEYSRTYRYSNRRLRVTADIQFNRTSIERHFSEGSMFLPGKWQEIYCLPAAELLVHGAEEFTRKVPKYRDEPIMLAHWHRPPLSVTFFRPNGTAVEVGTGSDIWRWEENFGYGPESGSYKIILEKDGIRFVREPLAICESFRPENRVFRSSWYIAWRENGSLKKLPQHHEVTIICDGQGDYDLSDLKKQIECKEYYVYAIIDFQKLFDNVNLQKRTASSYDYIRGIETGETCWSSNSTVSNAKKLVRKLSAIEGLDGIIFKNPLPGICYNPSHVHKKHENGTAHWDINALFDFASWANNHCKDKLTLHVETEALNRPSITGLFS